MSERNGNGNVKLVHAVMLALVTMLLGIVVSLGTTGMTQGGRIAAVEARVTAGEQRYDLLTSRLDRIESKLDRLIERSDGGE